MEKNIKITSYWANNFDLDKKKEVVIKNTDNYQDEYFIVVIENIEYMFNKKEFMIAINDATNYPII